MIADARTKRWDWQMYPMVIIGYRNIGSGMSGRKWYKRKRLVMVWREQIVLPLGERELEKLSDEYLAMSSDKDRRAFTEKHLGTKPLRRFQANGTYFEIDGKVYDD